MLFEKRLNALTNERLAMRVSRRCIYCNVALTLVKLFAGIFGRSAAMVSDSVHSLSDIFGTAIVMIGVRLSNKRSDKEHPYGHERFECVAAIVLAAVLFATGVGIGWAAVNGILNRNAAAIAVPGAIALAAAVLSIIIKEAMYWYTRAAAKSINSTALMAEAWHHRSDALSSVGSFAGILGARLGLPILDPLAGIVISLFIVKAAVDIFREAVGKMTDKACDDATTDRIRRLVLSQDSVVAIDRLMTRLFGDKIYVDVEISVNGAKTLHEAHGIAQAAHDAVEHGVPNIKHCMIHVNPSAYSEDEDAV